MDGLAGCVAFLHSSSKEHVDALHDIILFRVVRVFLGGNFQHGRNGGIIVLEDMSNVIGNVLVNQNDPDILTSGKVLKGLFDLWQFGVLLDHQKIGALGIAVSHTRQEKTSDGVLGNNNNNNTNKFKQSYDGVMPQYSSTGCRFDFHPRV